MDIDLIELYKSEINLKNDILTGGDPGMGVAGFVASILGKVGEALYNFLINVLGIRVEGAEAWYIFWQWEFGAFWKYLYWCARTCIYLIIFAIGGPIVTLVGIFMLYGNIYEKFNERSMDQAQVLKEQGDGNSEESQGGDSGE